MALMLGTAGHVDHGKTALINCLTGINTAHLPEEKKRGMTIDLGFASLNDPVHGRVGIIDVPGHERFIRNMVSGTWGLDAALLLIAADDGWMPMSTDHLRVLKAMGVNAILALVTKIDIATPERIAEVQAQVELNSETILGRTLPVCQVSAHSGEGIDTLKKKISILLSSVKKRAEPNTPLLYIDRSFVLKGIGQTVTGTLRAGQVKVGEDLLIFPPKNLCRIKNIQNHNADIQEALPASRTALNIKVTDKDLLGRGMLLANPKADILSGTHLIIRVTELFSEADALKNHLETEIALGSTHAVGKLHFSRFEKSLARMSVTKPLAAYYNQPAVLIRHGGSSILASCRIIGVFENFTRALVKDLFQVYTQHQPQSRDGERFYLFGFIAAAKKEASGIPEVEGVLRGAFFVNAERLKKWNTHIMAVLKKSRTGITVEEIALHIPQELKSELLRALVKEKKLLERSGRFFDADSPALNLNATAKQLLKEARKANLEGLPLKKDASAAAQRKEAKALVTNGQLIQLDEYLYYDIEAYNLVCKKLFTNKKAGQEITIADARQATGLSRKYIIPLFNLLERRGFLRRQGDIRTVIKIPTFS